MVEKMLERVIQLYICIEKEAASVTVHLLRLFELENKVGGWLHLTCMIVRDDSLNAVYLRRGLT